MLSAGNCAKPRLSERCAGGAGREAVSTCACSHLRSPTSRFHSYFYSTGRHFAFCSEAALCVVSIEPTIIPRGVQLLEKSILYFGPNIF